MRAFSRDALQHYVPVIQEEVSACLAQWLDTAGPCLLVYPEVKRLMFRIAMRILLGFQPRQASPDGEQQLVEAFEEMIRNLFSLPIDVPFSGLYRVRLLAGEWCPSSQGSGEWMGGMAVRSKSRVSLPAVWPGLAGAQHYPRQDRGEHPCQDGPQGA